MNSQLQRLEQKIDRLVQEVEALKKAVAPSEKQAPNHLSIADAAQQLRLSTSRVYALIYGGKLRPLQSTKYSRIQFDQQTINEYLYGKQPH